MTVPVLDMTEQHLEPRVARLETGLETLTRNVSDMAVSMKENSAATNQKIDGLIIAVTTAQAPKKTDWTVIIAALGLCLAIGAAIFVPLNNQANDNKMAIMSSHELLGEHMKLTLHPVGSALLQRLEEQITAHATLNERVMKDHTDSDTQEFSDLDEKLQLEYTLINAKLESQLESLDIRLQKEFGLTQIRNDARITKLEAADNSQQDLDQQELRQWRNKAIGLSTPASVAPNK